MTQTNFFSRSCAASWANTGRAIVLSVALSAVGAAPVLAQDAVATPLPSAASQATAVSSSRGPDLILLGTGGVLGVLGFGGVVSGVVVAVSNQALADVSTLPPQQMPNRMVETLSIQSTTYLLYTAGAVSLIAGGALVGLSFFE